jgi:hypothetical protein
MKKLALAILALLATAPVMAQVVNPSILAVSTLPGSCTTGTLPAWILISTGVLYTCQGGVPTATGGSGSFSALTGDATSTSTGGATTVQGMKGVLFCTGYTPTNGEAVTLTTASSPNPCYTAATAGLASAANNTVLSNQSGSPAVPMANSINGLFNKQMAYWENFGDSYNACYGAFEQTHTSWCALFASSVNTNEVAYDRAIGGTTVTQIGTALWNFGYQYPDRQGIFTYGTGANDGAHDPDSYVPTSTYAINWLQSHNDTIARMVIPPTYRCWASPIYNAGTYNAGTTYPINASVVSSAVQYYSLVASNVGNTPASSPSDWAVLETPNAAAGVYTNAATVASIQTQCNAPTYSSAASWAVDTTIAPNTTLGIVADQVPGGTQATTTAASASVTDVINDPSGASTAVGVGFEVGNSQTGSFTVTIDGTLETDQCSGTTTFSSSSCGASIYPTSPGTALYRQQFTVTPAATHTVVFATTAGNSTKVVFSYIDLVPPVGTPGINYVLDAGGNEDYGGQTTYNYLHNKDDATWIAEGLPVIPYYQDTLIVTAQTQGTSYTSNPTCTLSGGTITNGIAAPTLTGTEVGGGVVLAIIWPTTTAYPIYSTAAAAPTVSCTGGGGTGASFTLAATPGPGVDKDLSVGGDLTNVPNNLYPQTAVGGHPAWQGQGKLFQSLLNAVNAAGYNILSPGANGMAGGGSSLGPMSFNPIPPVSGAPNGAPAFFYMNGKPTGLTPSGLSATPFCAMWNPIFVGICLRTDTSSNGPWGGSTAAFEMATTGAWITFGSQAGAWYSNNFTPHAGCTAGGGLCFSLGNRNPITGTTAITSATLVTTGVASKQIPVSTTAYTAPWNLHCIIGYQEASISNTVQFGIGMNANPTAAVITNQDSPGIYVAPVVTSNATLTTPIAISAVDTVTAANTTYVDTIDVQVTPTTTSTQTVTIYALTSGGTLTIEPSSCNWIF